MKVVGIFLISLFIFSCKEETVQPDKYVNTISYKILNIVNQDTYYVNDAETGVDNIVLQSYQFITDSNQLFYRNPVVGKENPDNFYTSKRFHDSEFSNWNRLEMNEMILFSEDYGKIEFSLDRLDDDFVKKYKDSTRYKDVKTQARYSFIAKGYYRKNGKLYNFNLHSVNEGRIGAIFSAESRLYYNINRTIKLEMSAESLFTVDGKVIEPKQENMSKLEKNFPKCLIATTY